MKTKVEEAAEKMRELAGSDTASRLKNANEAETRLLIVDRVLSILGWSPEEYKPEQQTSTGRYTDYLLTIDRQPRLIVEAKRYGLVAPLSKTLQQAQYQNSYLHKSCGEEMSALLDQCRMYCSDWGIPYAVATTGNMWIILVGLNIGVEWGKLRSFVFHSLEDIANRFDLFYGLVSRDCVKDSSLEEKFGSMILVKPNIAIRPRDKIDERTDIGDVLNRRAISMFFDTFMGDITRHDRVDMLEHCYVDSRETIEFSRDLRALLEYDVVLDEQDEPIVEVSKEELEQEIDYQWHSGNPRTILLVGRIGSGKSTFVHKFVREQSRPKNNVCIVVDLINRAAMTVEQSREEEQRLSELILEKLFDQFRDKFDPYDPAVLRGCFRKEVEQFKTRRPQLFQRRQEEYILQEEQYLHQLSEDKYKHLVGYAKFIRNKKYRIWITLDNVDQGTYSYQEFVYAFAHQLSSESGGVTLITLREDTFLEAQDAGFLNVRSSDYVFRLNVPELRQIIARRRKYVDYVLENGKLSRSLASHRRLVNILSWHIKVLLSGNNDTLRAMISALSLGNIRYSLQLVEDYYTSYHSLFHDHYTRHAETDECPEDSSVNLADEFTHFIQALMLRSDWSYDERDSEIANLFAVDAEEQSSHFISLVILTYLSRERPSPKNVVKLEDVCRDLVFFGYQRHHIESVIKKLLSVSIVVSPKVPVGMFKKPGPPSLTGDMRLAISAKGYYYLNNLVSHPYYQTRVAEDTIWYDEERVRLYIKAMEESIGVQGTCGTEDYLLATNAREIFSQYLRRAWLQEYQAGRSRSQSERMRIINSLVEQRVFGSQITQSVFVKEEEPFEESERPIARQTTTFQFGSREMQHRSEEATEQLSIFPIESIDYDKAFRDVMLSLGPMPRGRTLHKSSYILRVLWAMEIAFRCGFSSLRPSDIARIINKYGEGDVAAPNVAKFFRNQRHSGEYAHLWKEHPEGRYTINSAGRDLLLSQLNGG